MFIPCMISPLPALNVRYSRRASSAALAASCLKINISIPGSPTASISATAAHAWGPEYAGSISWNSTSTFHHALQLISSINGCTTVFFSTRRQAAHGWFSIIRMISASSPGAEQFASSEANLLPSMEFIFLRTLCSSRWLCRIWRSFWPCCLSNSSIARAQFGHATSSQSLSCFFGHPSSRWKLLHIWHFPFVNNFGLKSSALALSTSSCTSSQI